MECFLSEEGESSLSKRIVPARSPFLKQEALVLAKAEFGEQFSKR